MCFYPCLISVLFTGPSLPVINFYRKFLPLVCVFIFPAWQQTPGIVYTCTIAWILTKLIKKYGNIYLLVISTLAYTIHWKDNAMCSVVSQICSCKTMHL